MQNQNTIYHISQKDLNKETICNYIYPNLENTYYWSDDFSTDFYINLAKLGFITVAMKDKGKTLLLPEIQESYALLDFENLHKSKKVKKLINQNNFELKINHNLQNNINSIKNYHDNCWLEKEYITILEDLNKNEFDNFELLSVELYERESKNLIAGEIGYKIGRVYTSLTGFCKKDKKYNNCGKLQLVLLANYLKDTNYSFWNLGHPYMQYKLDLGAIIYNREDFLIRWLKSTKENL